jgi:hypothetical protein
MRIKSNSKDLLMEEGSSDVHGERFVWLKHFYNSLFKELKTVKLYITVETKIILTIMLLFITIPRTTTCSGRRPKWRERCRNSRAAPREWMPSPSPGEVGEDPASRVLQGKGSRS